MNKKGFQRNWFFWVDRLQITKRERLALSWVFLAVCALLLVNVFVKPKLVPEPENHAAILEEFQRFFKKQKSISYQGSNVRICILNPHHME